ncbi:phosphatidylinositol mannoside acyltransferase [Kineococcus gynurae]|uniref:Phosphatidylinositol mannoside acyltransferase n=1 Tax=Kineococcus gynurae TaxID=452979 RepID=A0ABV5LUU5_9ACTN
MNRALLGFRLGWRVLPHLPEPAVLAVAEAVAARLARAGGDRVAQYRRSLARVRPDLPPDEVDHLLTAGLRAYARYWVDLFRLPAWSGRRVDVTVVAHGDAAVRTILAEGRGVVAALPHQGNWDQAGAWAARHLGPVLTVAERLEPPELYREFVAQRARLGIEVLPLGDAGTTATLLRRLRSGQFVALLGDRDLGGDGVPVDFGGAPARIPAGPAWLALASGAALVVVGLRTEPLPRRDPARRTGARWRLHLTFTAPLEPVDAPRREQVGGLTQQVADELAAAVRRSPADWHVLQPFFHDDPEDGARGPGPEPGRVP